MKDKKEKQRGKKGLSLLLVAMLCFSGCNEGREAPIISRPPTQNAEVLEPGQNITHIAYRDSLMDIAISPNGIYLVQAVRPASVNLFYIDAQTKQQLYLCAVPNCNHDSQVCTSYLPLDEEEYGYQLFFYNGALYVAQCSTTEKHAPYLMRLGVDGSERKKVVELNSGENFFGCLFGYGDSVLIEISAVTENGAGGLYLEKINLQTGQRETLLEYPQKNGTYYSAMGAVADKLMYISIDARGHQYFQVDPSIPGQSLIECQSQASITEFFDGENVLYTLQNDYLCGLDRNTQKLSYQNLVTGEKKEFDIPPLEQGDTLYGLELLYDNEFALTLDDANGNLIRMMWDGKTGKSTGVRYAQTKQNNNTPVAVFEDTLIYMSREAEAPLRDQAEYGLSGEMRYYTVYGTVSKELFLKGEKGIEIPFPKD